MDLQNSQLNSFLYDLIYNKEIFGKIAYYLLFCLSIFFIANAIYARIKNRKISLYYFGICLATLLSAICFLTLLSNQDVESAQRVKNLGILGIVCIPVLLCRHIREQVSYRNMNILFSTLLYIVPICLSLILLRDIYFPHMFNLVPKVDEFVWYTVAFYLYAGIALIRAFLFCFNVFFQMSPRMRVSTWFIILSISSISLLLIFYQILSRDSAFFIRENQTMRIILSMATATSLIVIVYPLYSALNITPADDVIVTSREFVVEGLTTSILVLNRRDEILDWNKKERGVDDPIPTPLYREPFSVYKQRIMQDQDRFSFFSEDVIIASLNNREYYYLLHRQEVRSKRMVFGYIIEISEITPLYSLLRNFEDVAYIDQLTSLHNRNSYLNQVTHIIKKEYMPLLILVGDVNRLKYVNDVFGHLQGDTLLVTAADIIKSTMPSNSFAARVGGDEFVILVPNGSSEIAEDFISRTERLCSETHHAMFGSPNVSWGYALMDSEEQSYNEVFTNADQMMYENKRKHYAFRSSGLVPDTETNAL